jgi:hypothetical protein
LSMELPGRLEGVALKVIGNTHSKPPPYRNQCMVYASFLLWTNSISLILKKGGNP